MCTQCCSTQLYKAKGGRDSVTTEIGDFNTPFIYRQITETENQQRNFGIWVDCRLSETSRHHEMLQNIVPNTCRIHIFPHHSSTYWIIKTGSFNLPLKKSSEFQKKLTSCIFSDHKAIKVKINRKRSFRIDINTQTLNNLLLNYPFLFFKSLVK